MKSDQLRTLTDRPTTPQTLSEPCSQNGHEEVLREIHALRMAISLPDPASGSPSYADVACTSPMSHPSNIYILFSANMTLTSFTDILYCTIDTSKMIDNGNERISAGFICAVVETEI